MAIYHLSIKTISRAAGRSATAAAAYRTGERITDERTGDRHDYRARRGVESTRLILPDSAPDWAHDRAALWNAAEQAETRKTQRSPANLNWPCPANSTPANGNGWPTTLPANWSSATAAPLT